MEEPSDKDTICSVLHRTSEPIKQRSKTQLKGIVYYFRGSMENGFSLNTRLTCLSYPRYHVFRATRITADFTVGSSDMSNTRWKKKLKEGFCEELFPSRSHRKHREQVIETRAKSPYFQSITRTVSFFFLLTRPTPD